MDTERRKADENSADRDREILTALKALDDKVTVVTTVLVGSVHEDKPGVMERLRKVEEYIANEKKLIYAISFIIFADVVMRIWGVVVSVP
jgi:hypothetical protein